MSWHPSVFDLTIKKKKKKEAHPSSTGPDELANDGILLLPITLCLATKEITSLDSL
jgi:hypothetical protein